MNVLKRLFSWGEDHYWTYHEKYLRGGILRVYYLWRMRRVEKKNNAFVPHTAAVSKFLIPHGLSGIFISASAKIGKDCVLFHQVTIGSNALHGSKGIGAPTIGDRVYIGAGAKIIGNVTVGNDVRIGANCVVTEDIPANSTVVLPKPRVLLRDTPPDNTFVAYTEERGEALRAARDTEV